MENFKHDLPQEIITPDGNKNSSEKLDIKIELASPDEWESCKKIRIKSLNSEDIDKLAGSNKSLKEQLEIEIAKTAEDWKSDLSDINKMTYLSKNGNEIIGIGRAKKLNEKGSWEMYNAYLKKEFQHKGFGKKMFAIRLREIIKRGGKKAVLCIKFDNQESMSVAKYFGGEIVGKISAVTKYRMMSDAWKMVEINLTEPELIKKINDILDTK